MTENPQIQNFSTSDRILRESTKNSKELKDKVNKKQVRNRSLSRDPLLKAVQNHLVNKSNDDLVLTTPTRNAYLGYGNSSSSSDPLLNAVQNGVDNKRKDVRSRDRSNDSHDKTQNRNKCVIENKKANGATRVEVSKGKPVLVTKKAKAKIREIGIAAIADFTPKGSKSRVKAVAELLQEDTDDNSDCKSVDDNTFNVITTENSESHDISELTNDDPSCSGFDDPKPLNAEKEDLGDNSRPDSAASITDNSYDLSALDDEINGYDEDDEDDDITDDSEESLSEEDSSESEDEDEYDDDDVNDEEDEAEQDDEDDAELSDCQAEVDDNNLINYKNMKKTENERLVKRTVRRTDTKSLDNHPKHEPKAPMSSPKKTTKSKTPPIPSSKLPMPTCLRSSSESVKSGQSTQSMMSSIKSSGQSTQSMMSLTSSKSMQSLQSVSYREPPSPTIVRQRLRSFGSRDIRDRKCRSAEFTIEIYESKRKPQDFQAISSLDIFAESLRTWNQSSNISAKWNQSSNNCAKVDVKTLRTNGNGNFQTPKELNQMTIHEYKSPASDNMTSPDSSMTQSITLDVSQAIREESEDSDMISPIKNFQWDETEPNKKNHIAPRPVKTDLIPNGTSDTNNVRTPTGPLEPPTSNNATEEAKKPTPMAFTVDLGGSPGVSPGDNSGGEAAKKLDIGASISKWAPKHRRNLSLTKVEENKVLETFFDENGNSRPKRRNTVSRLDKVEEGVGKPPVGRPRSGTVGSSGGLLSGVRRIGGYHSEGYFSSDQDDDQANKRTQHTELKSPRSPKTPELRSPLTPQRVARTISQDSAKGPSLRKHSSKSECEAYSPNTKKSSILELTAKSKGEPDQKSDKMSVEVQNMTTSIQSISSCQTYDVNKEDLEFNKEVVADDVSETGTYTIEKDSSSPEVEQARNNIDQVFGVSATESEADVNRQRPVSTATEDNWELNVENDKYKCSTSLSRSSPNWIQQWAAQVAEHTKAPEALPKDGLVSPRGSKAPLTSLSSSQESSDSRPRRKLPTPPAYTPSSPHASVALTSSRTSDISDHETSNKSMRDPYDKPRSPLNQNRSSPLAPSRLPISQSRSPHGQKSLEYLRDSECFLRDTQQLMTSLQARVNKGKNPGNRGLSFESHDSGGDSDIDTSTSYANTDQDSRLSKALKNKIKSNTIDSLTRQIAVVTSPKRTEVKSGHHLRRERSSMSEVGYEAFAARHEDQTLPSDSSSETSDHAKDCRKNSDNNPPLKFNRAFSLRRARLDEPPPQKNEKKKIARPSSAGTNSRRTPLNTNKSSQGEYGTRGSSSQATTPKSNSSDFNRGDGGRFSLRLPRSASTTAVAKSPSRTSVKKELQHGVRKNIGLKSNSTMSSKEADFQNWKRRKSYDPMKAAAEGRKKQLEMKEQQPSQERTPSPEPLSLLRSQSFHGPEGMAVNNRWPRRPNNLYGSEEEGPYSLEEEQQQHVPQLSPIRRSPTSPHHLSSPSHSLSPHRQAQINAARRRGSYTLSDEGETNGATLSRKTSLDESGSEGKRSPMGSTRGVRSKAKSEALDNLVISTIHSLSVKVRTTSETLLQRLKSQYDEDGDRAALLEEVLAHLSESDQNLSSTQTHSTSRELAGILRNLKKIESALQVIDQVILSEDEEEQDDDDDLEDGTHNNHWGDDY
ncbi:unnamed protein product [Meganyctiphanes norvegica]|uniref:Uncharacterized protein n=1 Tax=Meganyctiphanes norvegica TaxID=48144 RepID=A0AAV2PPI9_MEGNR